MDWHIRQKEALLQWLLEPEDPGARYLALRDLMDVPADDPELRAARRDAHSRGPIATILREMAPEGYWVTPGPGYGPKYSGTVWSILLLAQLGASIEEDERIGKACAYLLDHALTPGGHFSGSTAPSGTADCLQGNLCWALTAMGCSDPRLERAYDWMARTVTGEGIASAKEGRGEDRYYASKCGPLFACGANNRLPCAWGGVKVMLALSAWPAAGRTPAMEAAIRAGAEFLLAPDPATANYPNGYAEKPSGNWWKFGFPVFYITDLLQNVEALQRLGFAGDPRLANSLDLIRGKQSAGGGWALEYDYTGKTWLDFGAKKKPNKWVTLRALRVMKMAAN